MNNNKIEKIKFIRWGDLSPVNHKKVYKNKTFHSPPARKGVYCFVKKYIEIFLVGWKLNNDLTNFKIENKVVHREFTYQGKIWTHLFFNHPEIVYYRKNKDWYETDTDSLLKILNLAYKRNCKTINKDNMFNEYQGKSAFKYIAKDDFEFYIERP